MAQDASSRAAKLSRRGSSYVSELVSQALAPYTAEDEAWARGKGLLHTKGRKRECAQGMIDNSVPRVFLPTMFLDATDARLFGTLLARNTSVVNLNLSNNPLGDEGVVRIARGLGPNNSLHTLTLNNIKITQAAIPVLAHMITANHSLTCMSIESNQLGDAVCMEIGEALRDNNTLQQLHLNDNRITSRGAAAFAAALPANVTLQTLSLSDNQIKGDAGLLLADALKVNIGVTKLNLQGNPIRPDIVKKVHKALVPWHKKLIPIQNDAGVTIGATRYYPTGDFFQFSLNNLEGFHATGAYHMRAILDAKEKAAIVAAATMNVVDFFSDLFVMIQLFATGHWGLGLIALGILLVAATVTSVSLWHDGRRWDALLSLVSGTIVKDAWTALVRGRVSPVRVDIRLSSPMVGLSSVVRLKLEEGLLESAPQAVLQVYIGLINGFTPALIVSACLSVASLGIAMATSDRRGLRNHAMQADKKDVRMPVLSPYFLGIAWFRAIEALCRLLIASLLAYTIHFWTFAVVLALVPFMWTWWLGHGRISWSHMIRRAPSKAVHMLTTILVFPGPPHMTPLWMHSHHRFPDMVFHVGRAVEEGAYVALLFLLRPSDASAEFTALLPVATAVLAVKVAIATPLYVWVTSNVKRAVRLPRDMHVDYIESLTMFVGCHMDGPTRRAQNFYTSTKPVDTPHHHEATQSIRDLSERGRVSKHSGGGFLSGSTTAWRSPNAADAASRTGNNGGERGSTDKDVADDDGGGSSSDSDGAVDEVGELSVHDPTHHKFVQAKRSKRSKVAPGSEDSKFSTELGGELGVQPLPGASAVHVDVAPSTANGTVASPRSRLYRAAPTSAVGGGDGVSPLTVASEVHLNSMPGTPQPPTPGQGARSPKTVFGSGSAASRLTPVPMASMSGRGEGGRTALQLPPHGHGGGL